jgi:hypothetical protein
MLALCHHAVHQDAGQQRIAALQCEQLMTRARGLRLLTGLWQMQRLRRLVAGVGDDVEKGECSLLAGVAPQPYAHPFERDRKEAKRT